MICHKAFNPIFKFRYINRHSRRPGRMAHTAGHSVHILLKLFLTRCPDIIFHRGIVGDYVGPAPSIINNAVYVGTRNILF